MTLEGVSVGTGGGGAGGGQSLQLNLTKWQHLRAVEGIQFAHKERLQIYMSAFNTKWSWTNLRTERDLGPAG